MLDKTQLLKISENLSKKQENDISVLSDKDKIQLLPQNRLQNNYAYVHDTVGYIAGFVSRKIVSKLVKCPQCHRLLVSANRNDEFSLIYVKNRGKLTFPTNDVVEICKTAEDNFRSFYSSNSKKTIFKQLLNTCESIILPQNILIVDHGFKKFSEDQHRRALIRLILTIFLELRIDSYEKYMSRPKKKLRRNNNRLVILNNQ